MKILLIYLKPKDGLEKVDEELAKIKCDKLILKYFPYPTVYRIALRTIIEHSEYSHLFWMQNDIVLTKEIYEKMALEIESRELPILGASMNVDLSPDGKAKSAYTTRPFEGNKPPYVRIGENMGLIKVFHNGGVFIAKREFFIRFPLKGMGKAGYNADILQGREIWESEFDYYLNADIHLTHLRFMGSMQVGIKEPEIEFIKN